MQSRLLFRVLIASFSPGIQNNMKKCLDVHLATLLLPWATSIYLINPGDYEAKTPWRALPPRRLVEKNLQSPPLTISAHALLTVSNYFKRIRFLNCFLRLYYDSYIIPRDAKLHAH